MNLLGIFHLARCHCPLPAGSARAARRGLAAALALVGISTSAPALAGQRTTFPVPVEVIIVSQLSFFKVDDLSFGRIIPGTTAGTVTVAPAGGRTTTGGVRLATGGIVQPATFAGKGSQNQTLTLSINATSRTLTRVGGTQTMTMDSFLIGSTPPTNLTVAPLTFRITSSTGMFEVPIGARLQVGANQAPGVYQGNFTLTLNYQ